MKNSFLTEEQLKQPEQDKAKKYKFNIKIFGWLLFITLFISVYFINRDVGHNYVTPVFDKVFPWIVGIFIVFLIGYANRRKLGGMKKYIISSIVLSIVAPFISLLIGGVLALIEEWISAIMWKMNWSPFIFHFNVSDLALVIAMCILQVLCYVVITICLVKLYRAYKAKTGSLRSVFYLSLLAVLSLGLSLFSIFSSVGY